jgi:hypothetical protein
MAMVYLVIVWFASTTALSTKFQVSTNGIAIIGAGRGSKRKGAGCKNWDNLFGVTEQKIVLRDRQLAQAALAKSEEQLAQFIG